ncbi:MAG: HAD family hydrolase [Balneolales bacterium]|nr:HAD family hydrolase [Balneolales bacterium]
MGSKKKPFVSIDFWNTIVIAHTNGEKRQKRRIEGLKELAAASNRQITPDEIKDAHRTASKRFDEIWLGTHRTPGSFELVGYTLEALEISATEADKKNLALIYEESLRDGPPELAPGVETALQQLATSFHLGIISDTMFSPGRVLKAYLHEKGIGKYFSAFAFSDEVGVSKPHPDMFKKVESETGGIKEGAFHVGDIQSTDIRGAQQFGINAILYTGISDAHAQGTTADYVCDSWDAVCGCILKYHSSKL